MIELTKNILDVIYATKNNLLLLMGILVFYTMILDGITKTATQDDIARILKSEACHNANQLVNKRDLTQIYHCLNELQLNELICDQPMPVNIHIDSQNLMLLKLYHLKEPLLYNILINNDSINKDKFLKNCSSAFKLQVLSIYKEGQDKLDKQNASNIELPIIKIPLPKSLIPNSILILIIFQLLNVLLKISNLGRIIKIEGYSSKVLKEVFYCYKKYHLPSLPALIYSYITGTILVLSIVYFLAWKGFILYKPIIDSTTNSHVFFGYLNLFSITVIGVTLIIKLAFVHSEIQKFKKP